MPRNTYRTKACTVRLTSENFEKLEKYARLYDISKATAINWWIDGLPLPEEKEVKTND